jgi:metal-responsive CopG/Arc/MetJ family transcriptional regulator
MGARSVQISIDEELLREVDRHRAPKKLGRSELIRQALRLYLELEQREEIDRAYARAYDGKADEVWNEFSPLLGGQRWPDE